MSLFDYRASLEILLPGPPYYALIMAAMRRSDSFNLRKLQQAFPDVWRELNERYNAPGGILEGD